MKKELITGNGTATSILTYLKPTSLTRMMNVFLQKCSFKNLKNNRHKNKYILVMDIKLIFKKINRLIWMILQKKDLCKGLKDSKGQFSVKSLPLLLFTNLNLNKILNGQIKFMKLIIFNQITLLKVFFLQLIINRNSNKRMEIIIKQSKKIRRHGITFLNKKDFMILRIKK